MDTRAKIVTPAELAGLTLARPVLLVTGRFDILRVDLARELAVARERTQAKCLVAVVRPLTGEWVPMANRAEMAAALRVVDYVLLAQDEDLESPAASLQPIEIIRLDDTDTDRIRQLVEHVQRKQSS